MLANFSRSQAFSATGLKRRQSGSSKVMVRDLLVNISSAIVREQKNAILVLQLGDWGRYQCASLSSLSVMTNALQEIEVALARDSQWGDQSHQSTTQSIIAWFQGDSGRSQPGLGAE